MADNYGCIRKHICGCTFFFLKFLIIFSTMKKIQGVTIYSAKSTGVSKSFLKPGFEIFGSIWLHLAPPGFELQKKQRLDQSKCRIWWSWSWSQEILAGAGAGARKFQKISNPDMYNICMLTHGDRIDSWLKMELILSCFYITFQRPLDWKCISN